MNAGPESLPTSAQSISVQVQGEGVWALFVQPVDPDMAVDVVASLSGRVVDLGDGEYLLGHRAISFEERSALPSSILAAPHAALPPQLGVRLALSLSSDGHAVFLSRSPQDLAACLSPLLSPRSPQPAQISSETLLDWAGPDERWVELSQVEHRGHRVLDLRERSGAQTLRHERWVAPIQGGHWRAGWSW